MHLSKALFSIAAAMSLTLAAAAQGNFGNWVVNPGSIGGVFGGSATPPTLPTVQYRTLTYDRGIGNSWLGGNVHAYASILRQKQGSYELGLVNAELRGTASVLQSSREVAELIGSATNVMNNGVQQRSGMYRIEVLGFTVVNGSFANNSTFAASNSVYNLIPGGVSASVPVGPVSVTLAGNAGCGFGRSANWLLPAATASVGLNASANAYAFADAHVGFGIPGFSLGVGLEGRVLEQTLSGNVTASAVWGLSGGLTYWLNGITLHLYAYAQAIWTWTTNLCSWSAGQIVVNLL